MPSITITVQNQEFADAVQAYAQARGLTVQQLIKRHLRALVARQLVAQHMETYDQAQEAVRAQEQADFEASLLATYD